MTFTAAVKGIASGKEAITAKKLTIPDGETTVGSFLRGIVRRRKRRTRTSFPVFRPVRAHSRRSFPVSAFPCRSCAGCFRGCGIIFRNGVMLNGIPVHTQSRGKIFLPFLDDDPKTAGILSKILLFADDGKIRDPFIPEQLPAGK